MKIRYCPNCVQLVHFESESPIQRCWNCGRVTNFDLIKTPMQRLGLWLLAYPETITQKVTRPSTRIQSCCKTALVVGVPAVITMLLVNNSFDVRIVHDLTAPFTMP